MYQSPEYEAMMSVARTYLENVNRDRKRLDYAYNLDKKKEKQGVGSNEGMNDSPEEITNKALNLERGKIMDRGAHGGVKRPKTRMPKHNTKGTMKKKD